MRELVVEKRLPAEHPGCRYLAFALRGGYFCNKCGWSHIFDRIDAEHIDRQREFSEKTFGPGLRTNGVVDHIRKELIEILLDPTDLKEWVDVIILAFDGAWRTGAGSQEIIDAIMAKQTKNEQRTWPDWRTSDYDKAIEHTEDTQ